VPWSGKKAKRREGGKPPQFKDEGEKAYEEQDSEGWPRKELLAERVLRAKKRGLTEAKITYSPKEKENLCEEPQLLGGKALRWVNGERKNYLTFCEGGDPCCQGNGTREQNEEELTSGKKIPFD